ncbi:MAG: Trk system potassium transporter TrkA [Oscillospiraceae bacterium]|nr:Trk system potassium transporter TrkA [Oscillospiraceae bacterium]
MDIIIMGCGKIGQTILASLLAEGHNVTAIDTNADVIAEITDIFDAMGVCGNGADCDTLTEAGVDHTDLFVAVTASDEMNMLACFVAKKMGAAHTIARIRNPEYNDNNLPFLRQNLMLDLSINPELLAARELYNLLKIPSAVKLETFSRRRLEMAELRLKSDSPLCGLSLQELKKKYPANYLVCVVQREEDVVIPDGSFVLQRGDRVGLTAAPAELQKLLKLIGVQQRQAKNAMLLGASRTAYYLARMLLSSGSYVKVIERDRARCDAFSEALPKAVVLHGDGARQETLTEEGLADMDAFVALTGMDEENILISFFAASQGVGKVIAKVNRPELGTIADKLGLDCIVSPRHIISGVLTQYVRALENSAGSSVETLYKLMDERAEALEFTVRPDFRHTQIPLKEMPLKKNILLAGILRGKKAIIPSGDDLLLPGDHVVVIAAGQRLQDLADIIR